MRLFLVFALSCSAALGAGRSTDRACEVMSRRSDRGSVACGGLALFEFAPASGVGMGAACACSTPTGAKGEALTFSRASTGYCTKSNELTGIQNGDLVECASGQPRVMPGGDGTGGVGLSIWEARTNTAIRSQEFDNAVWVPSQSGGPALPVVTANAATAPDGTLTAEQLDLPAVSGATQYSILIGGTQCPASAAASAGLYAKLKTGTTGTIEIYTAAPHFVCNINSTTWTRCRNENFTAGSVMYIGYGGSGTSPGGPAESVYIWQADCQAGTTLSPPIKTAGTSATRVAESATVVWPPVATIGSTAATIIGAGGIIEATGSGARPLNGAIPGSLSSFDSTANAGPVAISRIATQARGFASWAASVLTVGVGLTTATAAFDGSMGANGEAMALGGTTGASGLLNGVIKQVCVDSSPTRCR